MMMGTSSLPSKEFFTGTCCWLQEATAPNRGGRVESERASMRIMIYTHAFAPKIGGVEILCDVARPGSCGTTAGAPGNRSHADAGRRCRVSLRVRTLRLVVNEAFACRIPAVVSQACGAVDDLVIDGETGFVVPVGNVDALAARRGVLARNPLLRASMGQKAREHRRVGTGTGDPGAT